MVTPTQPQTNFVSINSGGTVVTTTGKVKLLLQLSVALTGDQAIIVVRKIDSVADFTLSLTATADPLQYIVTDTILGQNYSKETLVTYEVSLTGSGVSTAIATRTVRLSKTATFLYDTFTGPAGPLTSHISDSGATWSAFDTDSADNLIITNTGFASNIDNGVYSIAKSSVTPLGDYSVIAYATTKLSVSTNASLVIQAFNNNTEYLGWYLQIDGQSNRVSAWLYMQGEISVDGGSINVSPNVEHKYQINVSNSRNRCELYIDDILIVTLNILLVIPAAPIAIGGYSFPNDPSFMLDSLYVGGLEKVVSPTPAPTAAPTPPPVVTVEGTTWFASEAPASSGIAITYGNSLFVSVNHTGTSRILTSPDGIVWTIQTEPEQNSWFDVAYGNSLFVAVASGGTINNKVITSLDGVTWTNRTSVSSSWRGICYGNGQFVAVANSGTNQVMTSPDGINWTGHIVPVASWLKISWNGSIYVAIASGGQVMTSTNGTSWTMQSSPSDSNYGITYGTYGFVVVGYQKVMTSPDGLNWTLRTAPLNAWQSVAWSGKVYAAVGIGNDGFNAMTSPDGITWTLRATPTNLVGDAVIWANNKFVTVMEYKPFFMVSSQ